MHLVTDLSLLVGDYLEVEAWHNKGSDSDVDGNADGSYTFFSISRIGT
jgi:hypothetical protein